MIPFRVVFALVAATSLAGSSHGFSLQASLTPTFRHSSCAVLRRPPVLRPAFSRPCISVCKGAAEDLPQAKDLIGRGDETTLDGWFEKLADSRLSIRTMAGMKIAERIEENGQVSTACPAVNLSG